MNNNLTIAGFVFFLIEALAVFVYLVSTRVSIETLDVILPGVIIVSVNLAFLVILFSGLNRQ